MNITEEDLNGFVRVIGFLKEIQDGKIFALHGIGKVELRQLKYIDIGQGMEYEEMTEYDFTKLLNILKEMCKQ